MVPQRGTYKLTYKTYSPKASEIENRWFIVDAQGKTLGRLASQIAHILRGKHKPTYTPHQDMGEHIVVINACKVHLSGRKAEQKVYYHHTGHPGGLKTTPFERVLAEHPERVIKKAVWGMLPNNPLGRKMFRKLRVYGGADHGHAAQQPELLEL